MAFNSLDYTLFLCVAFLGFWQLMRFPRARLLFLLAASYVFYTVWNGWLVLLIVLSSSIDYVCGYYIERFRDRPRLRRAFFLGSVVSNLSILGFFKYVNFFVDNANAVVTAVGYDPQLAHLDILLPIGISFYTFQSLSYTLDIYLGEIKPVRSPRNFFLFVAFFPQLVAGPIVRARELLPQFDKEPVLSQEDLGRGLFLVLRGLLKKMVIADYLAHAIVDPVFATPDIFSSLEMFLALAAFHFQVYNDFSGYTDIALGSAALFGYKLPDNFNTPYIAHTPANFWHRWHMTLSRFAFDYLYKPLGGSRRGAFRTYLNVFITFTVIGFWHGASWTYVMFGVYHAFGVFLTRLLLRTAARRRNKTEREMESALAGKVLPILATNLFVIMALPFFRAPDLDTSWDIYAHVFSFNGASVGFSAASMAVFAVAIITHFIPDIWQERWRLTFGRLGAVYQGAVVLIVGMIVHQVATLAKQSFVYFQF